MFNAVKSFVLDVLFPSRCISCKADGGSLCANCVEAFPTAEFQCIGCGERNKNGATCATCKRAGIVLTRVVWLTSYHHAIVKKSITEFKYFSRKELAAPLGILTAGRLAEVFATLPAWRKARAHLLAVPLHPRKERERGYNQSYLLAIQIALQLQIPLLPPSLLTRVKYTKPQAKTESRAVRLENVAGAFSAKAADAIVGKTIILVDDITTTGTTLNEAAKALRAAGAKEVWAVVVARG
jgi:competence protein ComFC